MSKIGVGLLIAAVALFGTTGTAEAGNLDRALLDNAEEVLKGLNAARVKNVGVLPFKVKKGARPASYDAAPLGTSLPGRLENALILRQGDTERLAIGIIRDAVGEANKARIGAWSRSRGEFSKLFTHSYPLAWGDKKVEPDAFLTGEIRNTGDRSQTEVVVRLLTSKSWRNRTATPTDLVTFKVKTDRSLLRDLSYPFVVSRALIRKGEKKVTSADLDEDAVKVVEGEDEGMKDAPKPDKTQTQAHTPDNIAGMKFEIAYDGVKQKITALNGKNGTGQPVYQVKAARPGQEVVMYLTRVLDNEDTLGVVLKVNGKSVLEEQTQEPLGCKRWIYAPRALGKPDKVEGTYRRGETGKLIPFPFEVLPAAKAEKRVAEMGARAGWIDIDVLAAREKDAPAEEGLLLSTRGLTRAKAKTLRELRTELAKANNVELPTTAPRKIGDGLLVHDVKPGKPIPVEVVNFPNPVHLGGISIQYVEIAGKVLED